MYTAAQISRRESSDPEMTEWAVELGDGRVGRLRVPVENYQRIQAEEPDEYIREGLADHLTFNMVSEDVLLEGELVIVSNFHS